MNEDYGPEALGRERDKIAKLQALLGIEPDTSRKPLPPEQAQPMPRNRHERRAAAALARRAKKGVK